MKISEAFAQGWRTQIYPVPVKHVLAILPFASFVFAKYSSFLIFVILCPNDIFVFLLLFKFWSILFKDFPSYVVHPLS